MADVGYVSGVRAPICEHDWLRAVHLCLGTRCSHCGAHRARSTRNRQWDEKVEREHDGGCDDRLCKMDAFSVWGGGPPPLEMVAMEEERFRRMKLLSPSASCAFETCPSERNLSRRNRTCSSAKGS